VNGAESLVHTLLECGVTTCFANPGTSEMHFVAALDRIPGMRCVLCLAEGVVTGAADGFARITGGPAATLLHCGPGLANGLANMHNARRADSPMVNVVGDQADYHRPLDPPLTADTEGWARGVSAWTRTAGSAATIGQDLSVAIQAARTAPGQIATLIAPANTCWDEGGVAGPSLAAPRRPDVAPHRIRETARLLRGGEPVLLLLGGSALGEAALFDAGRIAHATGAKLLAHQFNGRVERGRGRYPIERLAYGVDQAMKMLAGSKHIVLIGAAPPVAPFAYPGKPGYLFPDNTSVHVFARPEHDIPAALAALAAELSAPQITVPVAETATTISRGKITPDAVTQTLAALLPENAIIVDESVSFGRPFFNGLAGAAPHDWLQITGGAIGSGIPMATGAAVGAPGRRVVSLQGDGAAMYTVPALWTQAREGLPVTTVILANRKYQILLGELANVGATPGRVAMDMLDIGRPDVAWVSIAHGMGVEAARAETMETFADLLAAANKRSGPFLIELVI
jgi:acetolactate synthase I/II/III large subunit